MIRAPQAEKSQPIDYALIQMRLRVDATSREHQRRGNSTAYWRPSAPIPRLIKINDATSLTRPR
jgi:hypothetical protein